MDDNFKSFWDDIHQEFPNAVPVEDCSASRHTPDTLDKARKKTADKLRDNKSSFEAGGKAPLGKSKVPDPVYKHTGGGKYALCVKYGNRKLPVFPGGRKMLDGLTKEQVPKVLDKLIAAAESKQFDDKIEDQMKANLASRNKNRQGGSDDQL